MLKSLQFSSNFVAIFADSNEICSDFLENTEKRCNFSKFIDFNFDLIFKSIWFSNDSIFKFSDSNFNLIFTEPPPFHLEVFATEGEDSAAAITQDLYAAGKDPNLMGQLQGAIASNLQEYANITTTVQVLSVAPVLPPVAETYVCSRAPS